MTIMAAGMDRLGTESAFEVLARAAAMAAKGVDIINLGIGQPDFATISILYTPNEKCVELKSLKLYLWSFRDEGHFHEAVTNQILDDLVKCVEPRQMTIVGDFYVRGGIKTVIKATHKASEQ